MANQAHRGKTVFHYPNKWLVFLLLIAGAWQHSAFAHEQPITLIRLDAAPEQMAMTLHVPLLELESAFGHDVATNPETSLPQWQAEFREYLLQHIRLTTPDGQFWRVQVNEMHIESTAQIQSGPFQEVIVTLSLTPPAGASSRKFSLHYDAIMHQVVTHKTLISIRHDWEQGQIDDREVGVIRVNTQTSQIEPLEINLEKGSWWSGFKGMIRLGMQHIREGTDHLLFLLVLLLPATLLSEGKRWGAFGGSGYSLTRLLKIVTAFTFGHSLTLLAGAVGWVQLPQQPVEVLIAFSILVSAIHAIRPVFPGKEIFVAAGFGLVHGLAFATVLSEMKLSVGPMALSLLGFNLGIELMQLFVVFITMPWLILLSLTPIYQWVRVSSALLAALAAMGWIATRVSGASNVIERAMESATEYSPLAILLLALIALPAYFFGSNRGKTISAQIER